MEYTFYTNTPSVPWYKVYRFLRKIPKYKVYCVAPLIWIIILGIWLHFLISRKLLYFVMSISQVKSCPKLVKFSLHVRSLISVPKTIHPILRNGGSIMFYAQWRVSPWMAYQWCWILSRSYISKWIFLIWTRLLACWMLSMSGEVVYKGDNFTHIGSPYIVY